MQANLLSDADLITALGDGARVATELAARGAVIEGKPIDAGNVYTWKYQDQIPWKWRPLMWELARDSGIELDRGFYLPIQPRHDRAE